MSVPSTLTDVLTAVPTPLGPTHVAVGRDTVWLATGARAKVHVGYISTTELWENFKGEIFLGLEHFAEKTLANQSYS